MTKRTSLNQLRFIFTILRSSYAGLSNHVRRYSLIYRACIGSLLTFVLVFAVVWYVILSFPLPGIELDPRKARFFIYNFKLSNYHTHRDLNYVLDYMFPAGTHKSEVDRVLIDIAGTTIRKNERGPASTYPIDHTHYYYNYKNLSSYIFSIIPAPGATYDWTVSVLYDQNELLVKITGIR